MMNHLAAVAAVLLGLLSVLTCATGEPGPEKHPVKFYNHNAQRLFDGDHFDQALNQFVRALSVDPENRTALLGRAWCLLEIAEAQILQGDRRGGETVQLAKEAFEELEDRDFGPNTFKVALGLGKVEVLLGDLYAARVVRLREEAKRRPPDDPRRQALSEAGRDRDEAYRKAESLFHRVLSTKGNEAARTNLTALIHLARISVLRDDFAGALVYAERYLEQVRRSKDLWIESRRRYPENTALWEAKLAGAVAKEIEARDLVANALYKLGRLKNAEDELDHVLLLDPDRGDAYLNRAIIRDELGEKPDAVDDLRQFLLYAARIDMSPEDQRVIEATKRLLRLEKELGLKPTVSPEEITETGGGT